ncbi:uncharacterized protein LOC130757697 [Actinidia eriantha]|uniref:uncharacterized protein LOC130757697 n=1 Tax=Actinidia eriantha TaxID=165200 RepID=UPI0025903B64|nr:uncharacterized protein LOC130757697 [Actinidia eriantha]
MVMEALQEDTGEGNMQCTSHPYKSHQNPGGICAFCLQEKLGKLVSSSFPIAVFPSSSSSSSPSFRSEFVAPTNTCTLPVRQNTSTNTTKKECQYYQNHPRRARIPFLLAQKKKKVGVSLSTDPSQARIDLKRSKSTTTPRRGVHFVGVDEGDDEFGPRKRGFWSFLYMSKHASVRKSEKPNNEICYSSSVGAFGQRSRETQKREEFVVVEENDESPNQASFDRKVSRSRSVGCGSRSFSGDFFERISTGFGDCTLRRVESQREGKPKAAAGGGGGGGKDCIKERVKCGGIFGGFMVTSSSSSSSSSSYWVSSSSGEDGGVGAKMAVTGQLAHGRSKSWGWALASPIRAFKPSSVKREKNTTTPNLNAIPSLLAVGGR